MSVDYPNKKTVQDVNVDGKKVFLRVDFNVPISDGKVSDNERIIAALPTIHYLLLHNAKIILASHLGRPKGERNHKYSLRPVVKELSEILDKPVIFIEDCLNEDTKKAIDKLKNGEIMLLENIRFYPGEEANDDNFARALASLADIYVNDAFGTAHRAHASTAGIAKYLPAVAGFLMEKEVKCLSAALHNPAHPFISIIGGAKVSDKIQVIENLLNIVDKLLIGGGMANTFLAAQGYNMQKSLVEQERVDWAKQLLATKVANNLLLPVDVIAAKDIDTSDVIEVDADKLPEGYMALDVGSKTRQLFGAAIADAKTIIWNGPLGLFEKEAFAKGTFELLKTVADSDAFSIVGGGDSVAAVNQAGLASEISHMSTGGGASLDFLAGKVLPGIAVLNDK